RVACVTPARRVAGRTITTVEGLPDGERQAWADAFCATGASQCGFCTPGIVLRLAALRTKGSTDVDGALLAHLCRCTGWRTIAEAFSAYGVESPPRDLEAASRRATIEGGVPQRVAPDVALGGGGFADDTAPIDALVAVPDGDWDVTLRTTWVEPAYLELDASWCAPGGEPATPLANGGAFGGKAA